MAGWEQGAGSLQPCAVLNFCQASPEKAQETKRHCGKCRVLKGAGSQSGECVATYSRRLALMRCLSWVHSTFTLVYLGMHSGLGMQLACLSLRHNTVMKPTTPVSGFFFCSCSPTVSLHCFFFAVAARTECCRAHRVLPRWHCEVQLPGL